MINANQINLGKQHILYDANRQPNIDASWFDPDYWRRQQCITGTAQGRGSTVFFTCQERDYALRHYHRGGLVAKIIKDWYCWTGLDNTRAWREWHLLAKLCQLGLPAPIPVAAHVFRRGCQYQADLISERIVDTVSLADSLSERRLSNVLWQQLGVTIAAFHNKGVDHADLNAHNVLMQNERFYVIDFDRGKIRAWPGKWQQANIDRFLRSLRKLARLRQSFHFQPDNWQAFARGYTANLETKG